ncbi:Uncharacterised protein [Raoultella planticola]|uniref:Uncharacterized protein n=1 Tax=Raoultella planticola TaxID=575 RepID=A0A485AU98_RAOPL|nr:Uncharacterised protein [Raoultella planticola]
MVGNFNNMPSLWAIRHWRSIAAADYPDFADGEGALAFIFSL